jgi:hypothetical protein
MSLIVPIVEGHGEIEAVPELIRRIAAWKFAAYPQINPPYRVRASSFLKYDFEFRRAIALASAKAAQGQGVVLILLDCEDGCPATLGPEILEQALRIRGDVSYLVTLAYREYETWFLYAASSLAGVAGLPEGLTPPENPEALRDAKGWLSGRMAHGYKETQHQVSLTARFDLDLAQSSASFRRLVDRLTSYL